MGLALSPEGRATANAAGVGNTMRGVFVPEDGKKKRVSQRLIVPEELPQRNFAPRGIAAILAPVTRPAFRRRAPAAAQILADWPQLAGPELAARAVPVKFAGGTLRLGCTGPTALELQYEAPQIIQRLNLALGQAMVERLQFEQQAPRPPSTPPARPAPRQFVAPPQDLPSGPLGEALARLYQGVKSRG